MLLIPSGIARYHRSMPMTLRLPDDEQDALRDAAAREHRSMQEVARDAIRQYVGERARIRDQALGEIVASDANLLDRLGSV